MIKTPYINKMKRGYFEVKNHLPKNRKQADRLAVLVTQQKIAHKFMHQAIAFHEIDYLVTSNELTKEQYAKVKEHHIECLYG